MRGPNTWDKRRKKDETVLSGHFVGFRIGQRVSKSGPVKTMGQRFQKRDTY
jgi:hypothetical protein